jgi:hypothetical protein
LVSVAIYLSFLPSGNCDICKHSLLDGVPELAARANAHCMGTAAVLC